MRRIAHRRELHEADAIRKLLSQFGGQPQREAGLADPTWPRQGHQPRLREQLVQFAKFLFATDQRLQRRGRERVWQGRCAGACLRRVGRLHAADAARADVGLQPRGCLGRLDPELARQGSAQLLELAQGSRALACDGVEAHQAGMRLLVGVVHRDQLAQRRDRGGVLATPLGQVRQLAQERQKRIEQRLATTHDEVFEAVSRQEVAAVKVNSGLRGSGQIGMMREAGRGFKGQHINPERHGQRQHDVLTIERHDVRAVRQQRLDALAHGVAGVAQIIGGSRRIKVGPQLLHDLLAVQPAARRQREQRHQLARPALLPERRVNHPLADVDPELAQHMNAHDCLSRERALSWLGGLVGVKCGAWSHGRNP